MKTNQTCLFEKQSRRVRLTLGELRSYLSQQVITEMKVQGLRPWPSESLTIPEITEADRVARVGPFEQRLASILGGKVLGGNASRDIVADGIYYEVKKPDNNNEIRLAGESMSSFSQSRTNIEEACSRINAVFGTKGNQTIRSSVEDFLSQEDINAIERFVQRDIPEILKGNLSVSRVKEFHRILKTISAVLHNDEITHNDDLVLMMGNNERSIERDIDMKTYLKVGQMLDVPQEELGAVTTTSIALAFDGDAFHKPDSFMADNWTNAMRPSSVFTEVDNVILATSDGYRILSKEEIDDVIVFYRLAGGRAQFRIVN